MCLTPSGLDAILKVDGSEKKARAVSKWENKVRPGVSAPGELFNRPIKIK